MAVAVARITLGGRCVDRDQNMDVLAEQRLPDGGSEDLSIAGERERFASSAELLDETRELRTHRWLAIAELGDLLSSFVKRSELFESGKGEPEVRLGLVQLRLLPVAVDATRLDIAARLDGYPDERRQRREPDCARLELSLVEDSILEHPFMPRAIVGVTKPAQPADSHAELARIWSARDGAADLEINRVTVESREVECVRVPAFVERDDHLGSTPVARDEPFPFYGVAKTSRPEPAVGRETKREAPPRPAERAVRVSLERVEPIDRTDFGEDVELGAFLAG